MSDIGSILTPSTDDVIEGYRNQIKKKQEEIDLIRRRILELQHYQGLNK